MQISKVILSSSSPRRAQLLHNITDSFEIRVNAVDEIRDTSLPLVNQIEQLALLKANAVEIYPNEVIIGADTIVSYQGEIFGKPKNKDDAYAMLSQLSNNTHQVITGVALRTTDKTLVSHCVSNVTFKPLAKKMITDYIATGSPLDKAGAYGIQDKTMDFIKSIEGDYFNIIGLPLFLVWEMLHRLDPRYTPIHNDLA